MCHDGVMSWALWRQLQRLQDPLPEHRQVGRDLGYIDRASAPRRGEVHWRFVSWPRHRISLDEPVLGTSSANQSSRRNLLPVEPAQISRTPIVSTGHVSMNHVVVHASFKLVSKTLRLNDKIAGISLPDASTGDTWPRRIAFQSQTARLRFQDIPLEVTCWWVCVCNFASDPLNCCSSFPNVSQIVNLTC